MAEGNVVLSVGVDVSEGKAALAGLADAGENAGKRTAAGMAPAAKGVDAVGDGAQAAAGKLKGLGEAGGEAGKRLGDGLQPAITGMAGLGDETVKTEEKQNKATARIINQLERQTALIKDGGVRGAASYEVMAKQQNASIAAIEPHIAALERAREAAKNIAVPVAPVISDFEKMAQAAGLPAEAIQKLNASFGAEIGAGKAAADAEKVREAMLRMGESAGMTEARMREFAASLGMSADQIAARFDKVVPAVVSDFEKMAQAAGLPAEAIQKLNASFGAEIGAGKAAADAEKVREAMLRMGESAGMTEARMREFAASLGMSADQIAARFDKVVPAVVSDFEKMAQAAGLPAEAAKSFSATYGVDIDTAKADAALKKSRETMLQLGESAGFTEERMRAMAAGLGMSADQIAARFDKVPVVSDFEKMAQAAGLPAEAAKSFSATYGVDIDTAKADAALKKSRETMLQLGESAGFTEERMRAMAAGLGMSADQIAARFDKVPVVSDFEKMAQAAGLPAEAIQKLNASFGGDIGAGLAAQKMTAQRQAMLDMGISAGLSSERIAALRNELGITAGDTSKHGAGMSNALRKMAEESGMSLGALNNGMRMIPMQMTDIVTSLASGMPPWMIFIQQGGQLKDTLGGTNMALRAVAEYVIGLINPFTLAAGAVGVLALAYNQGSKEADGYRLALANTGNAAGVTTGQLAGMAKHVSDTVGTTGAAAEALTALAATGRVAGSDMEKFAEAALWAQKGLGVGVGETAKVFAELGKSPAEASAKLNESLNYLTASTYRQIRAAEEMGDKEGAAAIAQQAYATAIEERGKKMVASLGSLERKWRDVADGAKSAWDAMLGIGREEDPTAKAAAAAVKLLELRAKLQSGNYGATGNEQYDRAELEAEIADQEKLVSGIQKKTAAENEDAKARAKNAALDQKRIEWDKGVDSGLSPEALALKKARKIKEEGLAAGADMGEINARVGIVLQPLAAQGLQRQMEQLKEYQAQIVDGEKLTQAALAAEHSAGLLESVSYFQQKKQLALNANIDQQAVIELEIAATKRSGIAQAEKASKLAGLTAEMNKLERERVAVAQQAEIDIASAQRKTMQRNAADAIKDASEALEARHKLELVKDADYYANAAKNEANYQEEKLRLSEETYMLAAQSAKYGSDVEFNARSALRKVERDIATERELSSKNALASAFEYGRTVDLSIQRQAYESSLVLQTSEERTKLLAIYDIEAAKLEKIRTIMATTPEGADRDKSIADIEAAAAKAKQGEVSKALNAEWKTHLDFAEGVARGIWDDYTSGAGNAAQNALAKIKKELFDELYKFALKPLVLNVLANITGNPVGGAVSAATGGGGVSGGLIDAGLSAIGAPSLGAIGGSLSAGLQAGWAGTSLAEATAAYAAAGETTIATMLGAGEAMGSFAAALGPVGLGIGAVALLAGSGMFGDNNAKSGGTYQYTQGAGIDVWRDEAGRTRLGTNAAEIGDNMIQKGIQSAADNINKILEQIGSTSRVKSLTAGAQSSSEKAEAMVEAYGVLDTGRKFGIQGEQKLNKTASPEEVIKEYQTALNQATLEAIKQAAEIPKSVKDMLQKVDPRGIENDKFNEYLARIISDAQAVITEEWTGMDVSAFGDLIVGMADTSVGAAEYMSSGISESIGAAWAGRIQSQFNDAMYTGVLQPIIMTATTAGLGAAAIKEQLGAAQTAIANMRSQLGVMKGVLQSDEFKGLMADMGEAFAGAQEPIRELQTYIPQTSKSVKSLADTASSASKDIADSGKKEADERKSLQDKLDSLTMTRAELLAKEREAVSESNRALFDQLKAREAFDAANKLAQAELEKQAGLRADLIEAQGDAVTATEMRRVAAIKSATDGMNEYNAELVAGAMMATNALEDQVGAARELQSISNSLGDKFSSLQVDLLSAKGDEEGAKRLKRQQELDNLLLNKSDADAAEITNLYNRNAAIEDEIEVATKAKKAAEEAQKAWEDAQKAARDTAKASEDAWKNIRTSFEEEVRKLRGDLLGNTAQGLAAAQSEFAIAQAQAKAGDQKAAEKLPELAEKIVEIAKGMGMTGSALRQVTGETAASLETSAWATQAQIDQFHAQATAPVKTMPSASVLDGTVSIGAQVAGPLIIPVQQTSQTLDLNPANQAMLKTLGGVLDKIETMTSTVASAVSSKAVQQVQVVGVVRTA